MAQNLSASLPDKLLTLSSLLGEVRKLWILALPLVMAMVGQLAIGTTDVLMVGWLGTKELAAVSLAMSLYHPVLLFGVGITSAITPLVAIALAQHQKRQARRVVRQGLWAIGPQVVLTSVILLSAEKFFLFIGQDKELTAIAQSYLNPLPAAIFFGLTFSSLRSYLTAIEVVKPVFWVTLIAIPFNALFNYILIFGFWGLPGYGVAGAALASVLANILLAAGLFIYCLKSRTCRRHAIFGRFWRPDWQSFWLIHKVGIPIGVLIVVETGFFASGTQVMGLVGTLELAAHQIALQIQSTTFMIPLGVGQAAVTRVGLAYGRTDPAELLNAALASIAVSTAFMLLTAAMFLTIPNWLVWPFLDGSKDASIVMGFAITFLAVAAAFQVVDGLQVTLAHILRGMQDTLYPMWIAVGSYWLIGFPALCYFALYTNLEGIGVWLGLLTGLSVAAILFLYRFFWLFQKIRPDRQKLSQTDHP